LPERNSARTPMQWSTEPAGGFTKSSKPLLPVISHGPYGFEHINVAQQRRDPNSMLNWTERIIRMRKEVPEIGWGSFTVVDSGTAEVLTLRFDWRNNAVLVVHNLSQEPREISFKLKLGETREGDLINLLSENHSRADHAGVHRVLLEPYGYRWYRVGGLDYLLRRSEI
jgi:maltose alpha-D-glucosyltransferase / alpha-amylase